MAPWTVMLRTLERLATTATHYVQMADGAPLATDVHRPAGPGPHPTIMVRTPYGRNGLTGIPMVAQAKLLARVGYAVVLQDVRGRFDSGGVFEPMIHEAADGASTAEWIHGQTWCNGRVGAWGLSYLGGTAWAAAVEVPELITALAVGITHPGLGLPDPRGLRHLDTTLRWIKSLDAMAGDGDMWMTRLKGIIDSRRRDAQMVRRMHALPVNQLDEFVLGRPSPIWRHWSEHPNPDDPYWTPADLAPRIPVVGPTAHLTGWYDIFLADQLDNYRVQAQTQPTDLVVGPWGHLDLRVQTAAFTQAKQHFDHHLRDLDTPDPQARIWLGGADRWWTMPAWPPPHDDASWVLSGGRLVPEDGSTPPGFALRYDPADPTPSLGGSTLSLEAGRVDCLELELRPDVVVHTSHPLPRPLTIAGRVTLTASLSCDTGIADLSCRLTDVDPQGRSVSLADGYARFTSCGGQNVQVQLHPVAHQFQRGHRLRILVAGGSFPAFDRNLGYGLPQGEQTVSRPTTMTVEGGAKLSLPVAGTR